MNKNCVRVHKKKFHAPELPLCAKYYINIYTAFWVVVYTPDFLSSLFFSQSTMEQKAKRIKVLLTKVIQPRVRRLFKSTLCISQPSKQQAGSNTVSTVNILFSLIQIIRWNNVIMFSMFSPYLYHQEPKFSYWKYAFFCF